MNLGKSMIFILGLAGIVAPARASLSFYVGSTGETAFNTATTGLTATEIDLLTLATTANGFEDSGTGVIFQSQSGNTTGLEVLSSCTSACSEGGLEADGSNLTLSIIVPSTYTAVSFNVLTSSGEPLGGYSLSVSATGFTSQPLTTEESTPQFVGAVTASGISNLGITAEPNLYAIDDVVVYSQGTTDSTAPDAPTLLLLGTGLIALGAFRFRRRAATLS